jgi:ATP-dependent RNA helicase DeaD
VFVAPRERNLLRMIERATRQPIARMELPTVKMVNDVRLAKFKQQIRDSIAGGGLEQFQAVIEDLEREDNIPALEIAAGLAKLVRRGEPFLLAPERPEPAREPLADRGPEPGMAAYRVEVGFVHGLKPGNLVGAIANEARLTSKQIGRIEIFKEYTLVELPAELPDELLAHLKKVWVAGGQLRITRDGEPPDDAGKRPVKRSLLRRRLFGKPRK